MKTKTLIIILVLIIGAVGIYNRLDKEQEFNHKQFFTEQCIERGLTKNYCDCLYSEMSKDMTEKEITENLLVGIQTNEVSAMMANASENCIINLDKN